MQLRLILTLALLVLSCSQKVSEAQLIKSARENYLKALSSYRAKEYDDAITYFKEALKNLEYLKAKEVKLAKFYLSLSYFFEREYIQSLVYLEDFVQTYKGDPLREKAFYYLILSYYELSPDPYRDQSYTKETIKKCKEFLREYPKSKYVGEVEEILKESYKKLAQHELLIARFYRDYGYYYSATLRYERLLKEYGQYIDKKRVWREYLLTLKRVPDYARERVRELRKRIKRLKSEYRRWKEGQILKRIEFLRLQIKRWERIAKESLKKWKRLKG